METESPKDEVLKRYDGFEGQLELAEPPPEK